MYQSDDFISVQDQDTKVCGYCKDRLPISEFNGMIQVGVFRRSKLQHACKKCGTEKAVAYYKTPRGKELARWATIRRTYGITKADYLKLFKLQGEQCAICGSLSNGNRAFSVDHDHRTNKVRGIICDKCNRAMGLLGDDIDIMEAVIRYLKHPPGSGLEVFTLEST